MTNIQEFQPGDEVTRSDHYQGLGVGRVIRRLDDSRVLVNFTEGLMSVREDVLEEHPTAPRAAYTPRRTIRVDDVLWDASMKKAAASGMTASEAIRKFLEAWTADTDAPKL